MSARVPDHARSERGQLSEQVLAELAEISALAERLDVQSPAEDFDASLSTDDMLR